MKSDPRSYRLFQRAREVIPGGVNSPVRAGKAVAQDPLFIEKGDGCRIYDVEGSEYIDYVCSWGPLILGHRHPEVIKAVQDVLARGVSFGAPVDLEVELAEMIVEAVDAVEMVRMVNSGTEATMSAVRASRAYTGRDLIVKFDGCYHGHADHLLVAAGSGVATLNIPGSPGVPDAVVAHTLSLPYNDIGAFESLMKEKGDQIAAVIVEPVAGNMGMVAPEPGFLEALRRETEKCGAVLIFDEVMCGFRVAWGGAQRLYGVNADLTCFGKIVGGGMPVGAYGGKKEIMEQIAPQGPVYQAGTLSGNPLAMAAGIATLKQLQKPGFYQALEENSARLAEGLGRIAQRMGVEVTLNRVGSMMGMFFTPGPVRNFEEAKTSDTDRFAAYYRAMLEKGIYLAPSQFEAVFLSAAHETADIDTTLAAAEAVMAGL
ncbi:glutamate-1-semialdehyde 2,1-aminomutase [Desulfosalsimonas propionicica]|uniref:Glutamate-1-semialdehyde 2,1-aminomutase n=1 Tax=Desulfosalsimonas propionicica TaxID=332175 RepID=A0A7W0CA23_9BACT|nr:glutamate-1-semialdehyde 2,1-aminomutase [Desulfosalsimonas propionicica]MBA2881847.1 glutamate-1-semialdehyde 2,1-aminomutase [Desulfosalsimonas propionicica]